MAPDNHVRVLLRLNPAMLKVEGVPWIMREIAGKLKAVKCTEACFQSINSIFGAHCDAGQNSAEVPKGSGKKSKADKRTCLMQVSGGQVSQSPPRVAHSQLPHVT